MMRKDSIESKQLYQKLLVIGAGIAAILTVLLNLTQLWLPLLAAALAVPAALWWNSAAVRGFIRVVLVAVLLAAPVLMVVVACMGSFATEYFSLLVFSAAALPGLALASTHAYKPDVYLMRFAALVHLTETGLVIAYIIKVSVWTHSVLYGAVALAVLLLTLMGYPPALPMRSSSDR